jgi:hypothetical protein
MKKGSFVKPGKGMRSYLQNAMICCLLLAATRIRTFAYLVASSGKQGREEPN